MLAHRQLPQTLNAVPLPRSSGSVKSERSIMGAKRSAARLIDLETVRFTGGRRGDDGDEMDGGRWVEDLQNG